MVNRKRLTNVGAVNLAKNLKKYGALQNEFWIYNEGFDDQKVSELEGTSVSAVKDIRRGVYGELPTKPTGQAIIDKRLIDLENSVTMLMRRLNDLELKINQVETGNKLANIGRVRIGG